jgi:enoyl-[acyl-carrier-protein] reductase (NADH)
MSSDLQGRNAVVFGVANKRSIAWSIAQGLHAAGMKLAITYQTSAWSRKPRILFCRCPARKLTCATFRKTKKSRVSFRR